MLDTGASDVSTAGLDQFHAWQREDHCATLDTTRAGQAGISLEMDPGLSDMYRLGLFFNNQTNEVVRDDIRVPAVPRLHRLLRCAGHDDIDEQFTLRDDREFNFEITADVVQIGGKPVLHTPTKAPDFMRHDAGTNFAAEEFQKEKRHTALRRAYDILQAELGESRSPDALLQMAVKAVNDTAGPDGLVPTLLVFGAYPRINHDSPPSPPMIKRAEAIRKAMAALHQLPAERGSKNKPKTGVANLSKKEVNHYDHAVQLRREGHITTPGAPFEQSDTQEINNLIAQGVFEFIRFDPVAHKGQRLFKARMVREVKGLGPTTRPYEKSRLVIQGYNDRDKGNILTQSPTVQRAAQRLLLSIALLAGEASVFLRDITQAYIQSKTPLNPESGLHWFVTYYRHHPAGFGMVAMQTDDTLLLASPEFAAAEEERSRRLSSARNQGASYRPRLLEFNGCTLLAEKDDLIIQQKGQGQKLATIFLSSTDRAQQYAQQRARGAYIASICQPEATFDYSVAAQVQQPEAPDYKTLNKRIQWQTDNLQRGLRYVPLAFSTAKLMVFTDGSFANNKDLSSQLGFVIVLANEEQSPADFTIRGNVLHWSSTKSKRVTRSVLASEIYGMVQGFDMAIVIATTLQAIVKQLDLPPTPLIVCTDSYSLYECLVKLGTTKEKRLMIDIMALRQSYEQREMAEIRWINGDDNPADAMTSSTQPCFGTVD
ncbi:polyprotein [Hirsutella rhossiliensis]|uniref:Polyprotein n=1 Tax=Hirsutella rhossiliensis TaxID=111463 RepID=A0A9P8N2D7_9HYPO|nr:polyprotein [Hirsutella rhossiliensis]KAH0964676.1 polyprotein [Hirsutella rhossiliensis]